MNSAHCPLLFFFNDTATTEIYTLSLHDALPICRESCRSNSERSPLTTITAPHKSEPRAHFCAGLFILDRKSTRLNSSHQIISYAVFCLKKKKRTCVIAVLYGCASAAGALVLM